MKLLILTQTVDSNDPVLGFFHKWIEVLSEKYDSLEVICLREGKHSLPSNVRVHSLGKEDGESRVKYLRRFYRYIWGLRKEYDAVFVHMNEEYVLLGGLPWKLLGKNYYLWRNFHAGSWKTDIAASLCTNVFCTSLFSYTARYKKTHIMPVGVDLTNFKPRSDIERIPRSVLSLSRIAPEKRIETLLAALGILKTQGVQFTATIVGDPLPKDEPYAAMLRQMCERLDITDAVTFQSSVTKSEAPSVFAKHAVFVNCSPSGMLDKTIFEAAACGAYVFAASADFARIAGEDFSFCSASELAEKMKEVLSRENEEGEPEYLRSHSLTKLAVSLAQAIH